MNLEEAQKSFGRNLIFLSLYSGGIPDIMNKTKKEDGEMIHETIAIRTKSDPCDKAYMTTYFWEESEELWPGRKRPVILICPGGAYRMTSDREAEAVAVRFMAMGYHTAVLRYSVAPVRYPAQLVQLAAAVSILKKNSEKWLISDDQVYVMGFSAGGHLAASLGVFWNSGRLAGITGLKPEEMRPAGMILSYPVITSGGFGHQESFRNLLGDRYEELKEEVSLERQVSADTPETFLWHTDEDTTVPAENSLLFVSALRKYRIPAEFHLFQRGKHGIGLGDSLTAGKDGETIVPGTDIWSSLAGEWLRRKKEKTV